MDGLSKRQQIYKLQEELSNYKKQVDKKFDRIEKVLFPEVSCEVADFKELDQSVFFNQHKDYRWAAVDRDSSVWLFKEKPDAKSLDGYWSSGYGGFKLQRRDFKPVIWREAILERVDKTYVGNDLCELLLQAGESVLCQVSRNSALDKDHKIYDLIQYLSAEGFHGYNHSAWVNAIPVNRMGEELKYEDLF